MFEVEEEWASDKAADVLDQKLFGRPEKQSDKKSVKKRKVPNTDSPSPKKAKKEKIMSKETKPSLLLLAPIKKESTSTQSLPSTGKQRYKRRKLRQLQKKLERKKNAPFEANNDQQKSKENNLSKTKDKKSTKKGNKVVTDQAKNGNIDTPDKKKSQRNKYKHLAKTNNSNNDETTAKSKLNDDSEDKNITKTTPESKTNVFSNKKIKSIPESHQINESLSKVSDSGIDSPITDRGKGAKTKKKGKSETFKLDNVDMINDIVTSPRKELERINCAEETTKSTTIKKEKKEISNQPDNIENLTKKKKRKEISNQPDNIEKLTAVTKSNGDIKKEKCIEKVNLKKDRKQKKDKAHTPTKHLNFNAEKLKILLNQSSQSLENTSSSDEDDTDGPFVAMANDARNNIPPKTEEVDRSSALKRKMEDRLNAARFRYINEHLYTHTGSEAVELFEKDKEAFQVYHQGFQSQVNKWPVNPVDKMIAFIKERHKNAVVADFGCGDAKIARSLANTVHSFDLVAHNKHVTPCDMAKVPLKNGSVDLAVFCLSLMGTNLADFLCEANRVLKKGGTLLIAEVVSRFERVGRFVSKLRKLGFDPIERNEDNKMFIWFEFQKTSGVKKDDIPLIKMNPCIYKRR